jgi:hypothetical protein
MDVAVRRATARLYLELTSPSLLGIKRAKAADL